MKYRITTTIRRRNYAGTVYDATTPTEAVERFCEERSLYNFPSTSFSIQRLKDKKNMTVSYKGKETTIAPPIQQPIPEPASQPPTRPDSPETLFNDLMQQYVDNRPGEMVSWSRTTPQQPLFRSPIQYDSVRCSEPNCRICSELARPSRCSCGSENCAVFARQRSDRSFQEHEVQRRNEANEYEIDRRTTFNWTPRNAIDRSRIADPSQYAPVTYSQITRTLVDNLEQAQRYIDAEAGSMPVTTAQLEEAVRILTSDQEPAAPQDGEPSDN